MFIFKKLADKKNLISRDATDIEFMLDSNDYCLSELLEEFLCPICRAECTLDTVSQLPT